LERFADVSDAHALVSMELLRSLNPGVVQRHRWATSQPPTCAGSIQSGIRAFHNQTALKLGQRTEDVEDEFTGGGRRVDGTIAEGFEPNAALVQVLDEVDQMTD
jgi:hypothetical protein